MVGAAVIDEDDFERDVARGDRRIIFGNLCKKPINRCFFIVHWHDERDDSLRRALNAGRSWF
jgi:hypothetical protein